MQLTQISVSTLVVLFVEATCFIAAFLTEGIIVSNDFINLGTFTVDNIFYAIAAFFGLGYLVYLVIELFNMDHNHTGQQPQKAE